jgi:hypothetical protein
MWWPWWRAREAAQSSSVPSCAERLSWRRPARPPLSTANGQLLLGRAKVGDLHLLAADKEDVAWLQVAVGYPPGVLQ